MNHKKKLFVALALLAIPMVSHTEGTKREGNILTATTKNI